MIDFSTAKKFVAEHWSPIAEQRVGTVVAVADDKCVEYEWGWVIHWQPVEPSKGHAEFVNEHQFPFVVDRITGNTWISGGTFGIERGIIELLQERPPEMCGRYPVGRQHWLNVFDAFKAAGAFTPLPSKSISVAEIVGPWVDPDCNSGLIIRLRNHWDVPIGELSNEMLAMFLRQEIATDWVLEIAAARLDNMVDDGSEQYDGQLANAVNETRERRAKVNG